MGWLKLTKDEERVILLFAERAKNERFSLFSFRYTNAALQPGRLEITMDPEEFKKELQKSTGGGLLKT
jgi:hypothetical protein